MRSKKVHLQNAAKSDGVARTANTELKKESLVLKK
jgi:hypothetical protein